MSSTLVSTILKGVVQSFPETLSPLIFPGMVIPFNQGHYQNITGESVPAGWALCNGANGTPDLRGRFVLAAGAGSGLTTRTEDDVGGEETHVLTTSEMPSHTHTSNALGGASNPGLLTINGLQTAVTTDSTAGEPNIIQQPAALSINSTGGGSAHNNMPPFYVLTYIMKL